MSWAALRVEKRSSGSASSRCMPRTWSATRRALRGATRTNRARALTMGRSGGSFFAAAFLAAGFFAGAFVSAVFFAAGFLAGASFAAGFFAVLFSEALESAVFEVASAAPLPLLAVSALGFGFAAGFFGPALEAGFFAAGFLAAGFFAGAFFGVSFFGVSF